MRCTLVRESLSARLDGEAAPMAADIVDRHLARCADCRAFAAAAGALHRRARLAPAGSVPDLTGAIVAAAAAREAAAGSPAPARPATRPGRADTRRLARWGLLVVGATQLVAAVHVLVTGDGAAPIHVARELGSWDAALAAAFLLAAVQPGRAAGMVGVVSLLVGALVGASVLDVWAGDVDPAGELVHLPDVAGLLLVWVLAGGPLPTRPHRRRAVGGLVAP